MTKKYFYILLFFTLFSSAILVAQESKNAGKIQENVLDISFYPNPVTAGKIYINSKTSNDKLVTIFDVLGKKVFQTTLTSKELNISNLSSGVYFIKFEEDNSSATRKLIVR